MRIGVLQLDDVRLGFEYREGVGVPIVFMGGVTSTTATWEPVLDRLQTGRPIYLLDHRGHGRSSHIGSGDYSNWVCLLYTSPSPRDRQKSRMPSSA